MNSADHRGVAAINELETNEQTGHSCAPEVAGAINVGLEAQRKDTAGASHLSAATQPVQTAPDAMRLLQFARSVLGPDWENGDGENEPFRLWCAEVDALLLGQPVQTAEDERAGFEALGIATAALEKLAKLGNGERAGNSIGNLIAQEALSAIAALASKPVPAGVSDEQLAEAGRIWVYSVGTGNGPDFAGMRAALAAQPVREPMWQPIETAPKDGRKLLLTYKNSAGLPRIVVGGWVTDEEAAETDEDGVGLEAGWYERIDNWGDYYQVSITEGEPTHWMQLPAAPGITKE